MKKKTVILLTVIVIIALAVIAWFYGYHNRKSNDNLPNLTSIVQMDEAEVNKIVCGYRREQLADVWGNPDESSSMEDIWVIESDITPVSYTHLDVYKRQAEDGLGDTVKPRLLEAGADLDRVMVIDDGDKPLTLSDKRIERAIRENHARLLIIEPVQAFLGADVDMNRANEVRPIFRRLGEIAQETGCAIILIGHLNKAAGSQSTYRGLGSIDITAVVRSLLFIGKVKNDPTTRVLIQEKSSLAPPGKSLAFSLGDGNGFQWIGEYDMTADELLAGVEHTETKAEQTEKLILDLLADGKQMLSADVYKRQGRGKGIG